MAVNDSNNVRSVGRELIPPLGSLVDGEILVGCEAPVIEPATAQPFASYGVVDVALTERAVASASSRAFVMWRDTPLAERRQLLVRIADRIRDNAENLARLLTLEQGKIAAEAQEEVAWTESLFRHYAGLRGDASEALFREEGKRMFVSSRRSVSWRASCLGISRF